MPSDTKPYPTSYDADDIFSYLDDASTYDKFYAALDANVELQIMGQDHHLAGEHKGPEAVKQAFIDGIGSMLDSNKPTSYTVTNAIGGGDVPWVCIEAVSTAKNVTAKRWNHEHAYIARFNKEGKIRDLRAYYDSHHTHGHMEDAAAKGMNSS